MARTQSFVMENCGDGLTPTLGEGQLLKTATTGGETEGERKTEHLGKGSEGRRRWKEEDKITGVVPGCCGGLPPPDV